MSLKSGICPIWGTPASFEPNIGVDSEWVVSQRAGGEFKITRTALAMLPSWLEKDGANAAKLSQYILTENLRDDYAEIDSSILESVGRLESSSQSTRLNLLLRSLSKASGPYKDMVYLSGLAGEKSPPASFAAAIEAWGAKHEDYHSQLDLFWKFAERKGLVSLSKYFVRLTFEGAESIEGSSSGTNKQGKIFVAMWFGDKDVQDFYDIAVKPAIVDAGYLPIRIDDTQHNHKIDDEILAQIRSADAMIVDLSCGLSQPIGSWTKSDEVGAPRGGVYFEAGFGLALGKPIIWTVKSDLAEIENVVHFDIRQFNQIRWTSNDLETVKLRIQNRIVATIG